MYRTETTRSALAARQIATFADDCGDLTWLPDGSGVIVTLKDAGTGQPDDAPKVYDRLRYKSDDAGLLDLRRKRCRIEIGGSGVGEGVAGDFMALAVKGHDLIAADSVPMAGPFIDQPARDIEGRTRTIRLENGDAGGGRAFRRIVEREADHRAPVL
jgi:hypothetical protein